MHFAFAGAQRRRSGGWDDHDDAIVHGAAGNAKFKMQNAKRKAGSILHFEFCILNF
jgi:hypothetical protein